MKNSFALLWTLFSMNAVFSQSLTVDATQILKVLDHNPAALNLNYLMDDDAYLQPTVPLAQTLTTMQVGRLRFPGGEKSDNYLWSVAPYNAVNPQFAIPGNCNWPNSDARFSVNYLSPLSTTLDFDELMTLCQAVGTEPLIVVAGDAHYNTQCPNPPTLQDLITNATEWIRYANLVKGYGIRYWMVGNESWNSAAYSPPGTPGQYAHDFVEFAQAMKAVDPGITVVANSQPGIWLDSLLQIAGGAAEIIAISNYPVYNWTQGYDTYRTGNPNFVANIESVIQSIGSEDIGVIVAEYNAIDWAEAWPNENDLGHALVNFQMLGDQIRLEKVVDAYLWNTRWIDNVADPQHLYDAIDQYGTPNATGQALAMWGNYSLDYLVFSDNDGYVNSFAMVDSAGTRLTLFLINKDYAAQTATVSVEHYPALSSPGLTITETQLSGQSVQDKFPQVSHPTGSATVSGSQVSVSLAPLSIHVLQFSPASLLSLEDEASLLQELLAFPNPVREQLHLRLNAVNFQVTDLKIINALGQELYSGKLRSPDFSLDVSDFPEGVYFLLLGEQRKMVVRHEK